MVNRTHLALNANDRSYFAIIKKEVHALAASANFPEPRIAEIDIIIAEMVTNLAKHAGGGQLFVKLIEENELQGIEIICVDSGPGMVDINGMMVDGVSTKNTLGNGLGAMKRLADTFQIFSQKDCGTVILVRVFEKELPRFKKPSRIEIRSVLLPKQGEQECGDGFYYSTSPDYVRLFLGDGLGHGPEAAKAVIKAGEAFDQCQENDPCEIIRYIHSAVKRTRGLVGTLAVFDLKNKTWRLCGVGNILTKINCGSSSKIHLAYNGIIGLNLPHTLNSQEIPYENGQYLIMCSDGIKSKWEVTRYASILRGDLSILSAAILKDFARNTDDTSVVVCKINL